MRTVIGVRPRAASHIARRNVRMQIKALREERDLTQGALADIAGIDRKTVNRIEMGHFTPNIDTLARLAAALEVPVVALLKDAK
jgi:DNA-binding XRE family transcriptional regulator